jgi:16S rRNA (adenine1518-N6/adenine1519-N6)-dimethyltransferase
LDPLEALPSIGEVIRAHQLAARHSLGQHFLLDLNLTRRIARAGGPLGTGTTIEIGPGPGGLTRALLLEGAEQVIAIERDRRCIEALASLVQASGGRLRVMEGDALTIDAAALAPPPRRIVANLPYNIATALLLKWLDQASAFESLTLMFQREVAERLIAPPGTRAYGRLSVRAQWLCRIQPQFDVAERAFVPPPKVVSSVLRFEPRAEPLAPADSKLLELVTKAAFGQRRKMLRASLRSLVRDPLPLLSAAGLAPEARAEAIPVEGFCALARAYAAMQAAP